MNKRNFLQGLLTALGVGVTAAVCARPKRQVLIQIAPLAGFQFHAGAELWAQLTPGQPLTLIREPANPHDPLAVRVDWQQRTLGYLPRSQNTAVAQMLDRGEPIAARIESKRTAVDSWQRLSLAVVLTV